MSEEEDRYMFRLCHQHHDIMTVYFTYTSPIVSIFCAISLVVLLYLYLKAYMAGKLAMTKSLFYAFTTFFILTIITYIFWAAVAATNCVESAQDVNHVITPIANSLYILQLILLLAILFWRVNQVFTGTLFALSKCTKSLFVVFLMFLSSLLALMAVLFLMKMFTPSFILVGVISTLVALIMLYLLGLFIYKLFKAFRMKKSRNDAELLAIIIKSCLLCFASTVSVLFAVILHSVLTQVFSPHFTFVCNLSIVILLYTNFLSVFLSFSHFDAWYDWICGGCHTQCDRCWTRCVAQNKHESDVSCTDKSRERTDGTERTVSV